MSANKSTGFLKLIPSLVGFVSVSALIILPTFALADFTSHSSTKVSQTQQPEQPGREQPEQPGRERPEQPGRERPDQPGREQPDQPDKD